LAQNNEKVTRQSVRSTVVGSAKVMSYEDIAEAQAKRDGKVAGRTSKHKKSAPANSQKMEPRSHQVEKDEEEIHALGLVDYCSVLRFD